MRVLEYTDAPEAAALLTELAKGPDGARLPEAARAALKRRASR